MMDVKLKIHISANVCSFYKIKFRFEYTADIFGSSSYGILHIQQELFVRQMSGIKLKVCN